MKTIKDKQALLEEKRRQCEEKIQELKRLRRNKKNKETQ